MKNITTLVILLSLSTALYSAEAETHPRTLRRSKSDGDLLLTHKESNEEMLRRLSWPPRANIHSWDSFTDITQLDDATAPSLGTWPAVSDTDYVDWGDCKGERTRSDSAEAPPQDPSDVSWEELEQRFNTLMDQCNAHDATGGMPLSRQPSGPNIHTLQLRRRQTRFSPKWETVQIRFDYRLLSYGDTVKSFTLNIQHDETDTDLEPWCYIGTIDELHVRGSYKCPIPTSYVDTIINDRNHALGAKEGQRAETLAELLPEELERRYAQCKENIKTYKIMMKSDQDNEGKIARRERDPRLRPNPYLMEEYTQELERRGYRIDLQGLPIPPRPIHTLSEESRPVDE